MNRAGMTLLRNLSVAFLGTITLPVIAPAQYVSDLSSQYEILQASIGPLGFVDGLVEHTVAPYDKYVRTDVNGAYKWNAVQKKWTSIFDGVQQRDQVGGVLSLAIDPTDAAIVYAAAGQTVYKSTDGGIHWKPTGIRGIQLDANAIYRNAGERLAVDPNNHQIVYFGTQNQGLFVSKDAGASWKSVANIPAGVANLGISFVVFDGTSKGKDGSEKIYVGIFGQGVYSTQDAGAHWSPQRGQPTLTYFPNKAAIAPDGTLYVTYTFEPAGDGSAWYGASGGAVYQFREEQARSFPLGGASQLPSGAGFSALAIDPNNPQHLTVGTFVFYYGSTLWNTLDGGRTWNQLTTAYGTKPESWWADYWFSTGFSGLVIEADPTATERTWVTDGFSVWSTAVDTQLSNDTTWASTADGIEELVVNDVHKIPGGPLLVATDDVNGFSKTSLIVIPTDRWFGANSFGNGTSIDFEQKHPHNVVRVGGTGYKAAGWGSSSVDGGVRWKEFKSIPDGKAAGSIAISSEDAKSLVWVPASGDDNLTTAYYSANGGDTWTPSNGAPRFNYINDFYQSQQPIAADRQNGKIFYLYAGYGGVNGAFYRSLDGGRNFSLVSSGVLPADYNHSLKSVPGVQGQLWINFLAAGDQSGIWRSVDGGYSWSHVAGFTEVDAFGFGIGRSRLDKPATYVYGVLGGIRGLYVSLAATGEEQGDLRSLTWNRITGPNVAIPNINIHALEGDQEIFGKVYIGAPGRGALYVERKDVACEEVPPCSWLLAPGRPCRPQIQSRPVGIGHRPCPREMEIQ